MVAPELAAGGEARREVLQGEVDAGFDGFVEDGDAVGGEEDDALEVFEGAEEDWWGGRLVGVCVAMTGRGGVEG